MKDPRFDPEMGEMRVAYLIAGVIFLVGFILGQILEKLIS